MLTPAASDPNRKDELKRREKEPFTFGSTEATQRLADDWSPTGLVTAGGKPMESDPRKKLSEEPAKSKGKKKEG